MISNFAENRWKTVQFSNIKVFYLPCLDGGGMLFAQDFLEITSKLFKKVKSLCEFGCGPGFIGFSLLAHGYCEKLCLIDVNPLAIKACNKTIKKNHLEGRVQAHVSDVLKNVPKKEKWDLVVGNPPHFDGTLTEYKRNQLLIDPGFRIHHEFYKSISGFLRPNGSVLFVENFKGSSPRTWKKMLKNNGLVFAKSFPIKINSSRKIKTLLGLIKTFRPQNIKMTLTFYISPKRNFRNAFTHASLTHYFVLSKKS